MDEIEDTRAEVFLHYQQALDTARKALADWWHEVRRGMASSAVPYFYRGRGACSYAYNDACRVLQLVRGGRHEEAEDLFWSRRRLLRQDIAGSIERVLFNHKLLEQLQERHDVAEAFRTIDCQAWQSQQLPDSHGLRHPRPRERSATRLSAPVANADGGDHGSPAPDGSEAPSEDDEDDEPATATRPAWTRTRWAWAALVVLLGAVLMALTASNGLARVREVRRRAPNVNLRAVALACLERAWPEGSLRERPRVTSLPCLVAAACDVVQQSICEGADPPSAYRQAVRELKEARAAGRVEPDVARRSLALLADLRSRCERGFNSYEKWVPPASSTAHAVSEENRAGAAQMRLVMHAPASWRTVRSRWDNAALLLTSFLLKRGQPWSPLPGKDKDEITARTFLAEPGPRVMALALYFQALPRREGDAERTVERSKTDLRRSFCNDEWRGVHAAACDLYLRATRRPCVPLRSQRPIRRLLPRRTLRPRSNTPAASGPDPPAPGTAPTSPTADEDDGGDDPDPDSDETVGAVSPHEVAP